MHGLEPMDRFGPPSRSTPRGRPSASNPPPAGTPKRYQCQWVFPEDERKPMCPSSFDRKSDLKRHQCIHSGRKDYCCRMCGKSFVQSSALHVHERTHTGERPHSCKDCTKSFADSSSLARHRKTHDPNREVGRRARRKKSQAENVVAAEDSPIDPATSYPATPMTIKSEDKSAIDFNGGMNRAPPGYLDSKDVAQDDGSGRMFFPPSDADAVPPRRPVSAYNACSQLQMPPIDQAYTPDTPTPTSYPTLLNTSVPSSLAPQPSVEASPMDDRRLSGPFEPPPPDDFYQLVRQSNQLSPQDKRELMEASMYGSFGASAAPRSQPWPSIETGVARQSQSQHPSPSTAASAEMPPTPADYRLVQRPKDDGLGANLHLYIPAGINGLEHEHTPTSAPPPAQGMPPQQPPQIPQQQQPSPPQPPPQAPASHQMPQQQPPPQVDYRAWEVPQDPRWEDQEPEPQDPEVRVNSMGDFYAELAYTQPQDAGTLRSGFIGLGQAAWGVGYPNHYGIIDDDKPPDAFGEQMPSQAFESV